MQFLIVVLIAAVPFLQGSRTLQPPPRSESVLVKNVVSGDTIDVAAFGHVRLLGITAPAAEAKARLASLLVHRWIRLEWDLERGVTYDKHAAYVLTEDGQFVNALLVREGLARAAGRAGLTRFDELKRAEREAQTFRRGIWGYTPPAKIPRR